MRLTLESAEVECDAASAPLSLQWAGRQHRITRVLQRWRSAGRWWEGQPPRDYWLVSCQGGLVAELYYEEREGGEWVVSRVAD